jgi:polar amino acid transport system substrate-binding protein
MRRLCPSACATAARDAAACATTLAAAATFACAAVAGDASAATRVYVNGVAPFAYQENGAYRGLLYDMLTELNRRTGNAGGVIPVPLRRAQQMALSQPNTMATFARYPEIESSYQWLCKLADDQVVLIARADSKLDISSAAAARQLRVGVLLGGPAEALARRLGFAHIETVSESGSNARKLALGRIDVWITAWSIATFEQRRTGGKVEALRSGAVLQKMEQYLAAPRNLDPVTAERWRTACASMRKDGTHAGIMRQYDYAGLSTIPCAGTSDCSVGSADIAAVQQRRRQFRVAQAVQPPRQRPSLAVAAPGHIHDVGLARVDGALLDQFAAREQGRDPFARQPADAKAETLGVDFRAHARYSQGALPIQRAVYSPLSVP